ncbi:unnamed protein product [Allacma fusca]|uniref:Granulins domain-containing protein n=1 Tax=Allacma fusca TaxID=39272 RepID=A0A8J2JKU2_9HEXA|nr:unnamed protein product [Allacma fusca]
MEKSSPLVLLSAIAIILIAGVAHVSFADENVEDPICPDHRFSCKSTQTCCSIGYQQYGCCPYASATCCPDLRTCCPAGYTCNSTGHSCYKPRSPLISNPLIPLQLPVPEAAINETITNNDLTLGLTNGKQLCPDGKQQCPESYTCCAQASGSYGCCPLTGGVCCQDKVHCCPTGTQCNTKAGSCDS